MTQVVTVHTDFTDLNQMAQGLIGRVDPGKVILPGPDPVDAGEWVQFAITLQDGTPGFAGVGRCVTAVDNGEERSSHQRFDVVIDSLQFDSRGQQVFEHILALSGYGADGEPAVAEDAVEDAVEDVSFEDFATEYTASQIEVSVESVVQVTSDDEDEDQATMVGESPLLSDSPLSLTDDDDEDDEEGAVARTTGSFAEASGFGKPLAAPTAIATPAVPQTNGAGSHGAAFVYANGLPFPAVPPRPTLNPSLRVTAAPRPETGPSHSAPKKDQAQRRDEPT